MTVPTAVMLAVLAAEAVAVGCVYSMKKPSKAQACPKVDRAIRTIRLIISDEDLVSRRVQALDELEFAEHWCPDDPRLPAVAQELADALRREGTREFREIATHAFQAEELEPAIEALRISLHLMPNDPDTTAQLQAAQQAAFAIDAGMVQVAGGMWIDHSEHPNTKKKVDRQEAEALCQKQGKRLCTEAELSGAGVAKDIGFRCCL